MKSFSCLFVVFGAFVGGTYACANQAVYDLCLKTGQTALGACGAPGTNPRCACAAQKQILACYSECPDDATVFRKINLDLTNRRYKHGFIDFSFSQRAWPNTIWPSAGVLQPAWS
jgi:hypothetical protein